MKKTGLTLIYTGNGKGKTTAALGQAIRAAGHDQKICIVQFIKGPWETGEAKALTCFPECIELHSKGEGFTWEAKDKKQLIESARLAWDFAKEKIMSATYDLVILDELTYLITYGIIDESEAIALLRARPEHLNIVITGRDASAGLVNEADLVTEMKEIKHPYSKGVKARKGIEW
ncbi:MAG: cob(I)yrinic acid a,c-diamide adenosyltransferase [Proteobacteria bacterium]|nr:cob(I)yrinic acid a,c-diamide adenosyltransferase [Pseudomonadota bacterium]MBU1710693.1 cob(I)yrinic acid a,c-diamide adenosyltransferase [Pseudomonadota bacterium]